MIADPTPFPGEPTSGRHRPERLRPLGIELHHLIARCGFKWTQTHHTHGGES